jgi:hypothetical protein
LLVLNAFYGAFAPACFALLGLWLVVVQLRLADWRGSAFHLKRSYGVALHRGAGQAATAGVASG